MSLTMLNVSGGEVVDDLRLMEGDEGFARVLRWAELRLYFRELLLEDKRFCRGDKYSGPGPRQVFFYSFFRTLFGETQILNY